MFVKVSKNCWINLPQCAGIEIQKHGPRNWSIVFDSDTQRLDLIENFRTESEAHEVLDEIWEAYRKGKPYFQPDPRKKMNVRLGDKWYADDEPIQTYFEVIQLLGLEKIEAQGMTFKDPNVQGSKSNLVVTKNRVQGLKQSDAGGYYILLPERAVTMKRILEHIASELGIIDIQVTLYQD